MAVAVFESLTKSDSSNAVYRRNLGLCYEKLGDIEVKRSTDLATGANRRIEALKTARSWYQKGHGVFLQLQASGALMPSDSEKSEQFLLKMKESDMNIDRLRSR